MYYITIFLFVNEGKEDVFIQYESLVLPILAKYNGRLLYRIRPAKEQFVAAPAEYPYEMHLISFASRTDFENFKHDEERISYGHMFKESVSKTLLIEGVAH